MSSVSRLTKMCLQYATARVSGHDSETALGKTLMGNGGPLSKKVGQIAFAGDKDNAFFSECDKSATRVQQLHAKLWEHIKSIYPLTECVPDETPVAIASIGCVFKGLHPKTNKVVAYKVHGDEEKQQLTQDLKTFQTLGSIASALGYKIKDAVDTMIENMGNELDYKMEALEQKQFTEYVENEPELKHQIIIPKIHDDLSCDWCICSDFIEDGVQINKWCVDAEQSDKDRIGLLMVKFVYRPVFDIGKLYADLHAGNFMVTTKSKKLVVLDFGCVYNFESEEMTDNIYKMHKTQYENDKDGFFDICQTLGFFDRTKIKVDKQEVWDYFRPHMIPYATENVYHFIPEEVEKLADETVKTTWKIPAPLTFFLRITYGLNQTLGMISSKNRFYTAMFPEKGTNSRDYDHSPTKQLETLQLI